MGTSPVVPPVRNEPAKQVRWDRRHIKMGLVAYCARVLCMEGWGSWHGTGQVAGVFVR
jgi:hypothetical protein